MDRNVNLLMLLRKSLNPHKNRVRNVFCPHLHFLFGLENTKVNPQAIA